MKSPFAGMDPYIEAYEAYGLWPDFHDDLIGEIKRGLAAVLPDRYFVQTGERSYIILAGTNGKEERAFYPDVRVDTATGEAPRPARGGVALAEPPAGSNAVTMRAFIDEHFRENFIEIYEASPETRLITCIEVLSPANKRRGTEGWEQYLRKRNALLLGQANLVEIDLVRGGQRMPMVEPWPNGPYYLLVSWQDRAPYCRVWPVGYLEPLPEIPVPLASPDPDLSLRLQPMIEAVYQRSRYGRRIDYAKPLNPPLAAEDATWLQEKLQSKPAQAAKPGRRPRRK
jgi:hypothetical protein